MPEEMEMERKQPVPIKDVYSPYEAASLLGIKVNRIWELSRRREDPFPLRRLTEMKRGSIVFRDEMLEWARRNFEQVRRR